jgi:hypothetical protein
MTARHARVPEPCARHERAGERRVAGDLEPERPRDPLDAAHERCGGVHRSVPTHSCGRASRRIEPAVELVALRLARVGVHVDDGAAPVRGDHVGDELLDASVVGHEVARDQVRTQRRPAGSARRHAAPSPSAPRV